MKDKLPDLVDLLQRHRVAIVASFPSVNMTQSDSQRGEGIFKESLTVLKQLNKIGYGSSNSNLVLDLVSNPRQTFDDYTFQTSDNIIHRWNPKDLKSSSISSRMA